MRLLAKCVAGCFILGILGLAYVGTRADAQDKKEKKKVEKVKVGDTAPSFECVDESGKPFKSSSVVGKKVVVLYFYPADFTGGCTSQACAYRDDIETLNGKGVVVIGVSGDSAETHKLFKAHHKLPFTLLADEKAEIAKAFGVPNNVGKGKATGINEKGEKIDVFRSATIQRWTVVIDKEGKIAAIDEVGKGAATDSKRVAELIKKLDTK
jgi:thioredoxin-dependent peroxiredoxin